MILEYGKRIKELREQDNVTQKQLADAIGVSRSFINQYEQQYDIIPIKRLNQIANYFHVSLDYLFGLSDAKSYLNNKQEMDLDLSSSRLKSWRKEHKFTQEKLADKLKCSALVIVHHENQRTVMGTPFLYEFCKKFHISADYLLGKIDEPQELS